MKRACNNQQRNSHEYACMRVNSTPFSINFLWVRILILTLGFITFTGVSLLAQDEGEYRDIQTIMGGNESVGGYGAISMQYTELEDRDAFVFGARGGVVKNLTPPSCLGAICFASSAGLIPRTPSRRSGGRECSRSRARAGR